MSKLDEIEARLKAATPGPWKHALCNGNARVLAKYVANAAKAAPQADTFSAVVEVGQSVSEDGHRIVTVVGNGPTSAANADLIAWAPCSIELLLRLVRMVADAECERQGICSKEYADQRLTCWPCRVRKELEGWEVTRK